MPAHLGNSAVATGLEKVSFHSNSQRKAIPKNAQTTAQLHSSHMLAKKKERGKEGKKGRKKVKSLSCVQRFATSWTVAHQAPLSMGFSSKSTRVGCHFLLQGNFPTQVSKPGLLHCRWILYRLNHLIHPVYLDENNFNSGEFYLGRRLKCR